MLALLTYIKTFKVIALAAILKNVTLHDNFLKNLKDLSLFSEI